MKITSFQFTFSSDISLDETIQPVTVAYDYFPEEFNYPDAPDEEETFDVFVFDAAGNNITWDIPTEDAERFLDEAKADFAQQVANQY